MDIPKAINLSLVDQAKHAKDDAPRGATLITQNRECRRLFEEAFRFEGWQVPKVVSDYQFDKDNLEELVIIDLTDESDVLSEARTLSNSLPHHKGVVIVGCEDAISTLRGLKALGFYYVYWPVDKQEMVEFISHVTRNQRRLMGVSRQRRAKKIAVVACKGGVGSSTVGIELSAMLAEEGGETVMVDYQYSGSNLDVLLGQEQFNRFDVTGMDIRMLEQDQHGVSSYLHNVQSNLSLLALEAELAVKETNKYTQLLVEMLERQVNFIVKDYSASLDFPLNIPQLCSDNDQIILVMDPCVSTVRRAQRILKEIDDYFFSRDNNLRVISVVNCHRPEKAFSLSHDEVVRYLGKAPDIYHGFDRRYARTLLQGKRLIKQHPRAAKPLRELSKLVLGVESKPSRRKFKR
ncbi:AAA family ATPase [Aliagarivorans taiwanensis]|uniref:AAA family ATPase n=1 Tax=Aliagarivorans taiwanensis TaxID=561966 RepID=UPI00040F4E8E|nr:P-loop NTPase [Aliagarivorans taiwanensis]